MKRALSILLVLLGLSAWATTYYVSSTGSDANNGTSTGTPWLTISNANHFSVANDTVLLDAGGTYFTNWCIFPKNGQTWASYNGNLAHVYGNTNDGVMNGTNVSNVTISNLYMQADYPDTNGNGENQVAQFWETTSNGTIYSGDKILNCVLMGAAEGCQLIAATTNTADGFQNFVFMGNTVSNCMYGAFQTICVDEDFSTPLTKYQFINGVVASNTIWGVWGSPTGGGGNGISLYNSCFITVDSNYVHDCGATNLSGTFGPVGLMSQFSASNTFQRNFVINQRTKLSVDGSGIDIDDDSLFMTVQYNTLEYCDGGGIHLIGPNGGTGHIVRDNLILSNCIVDEYEIYVQSGSSNQVYNNTIIGRNGCYYDSGTSHNKVINNIFTTANTIATFDSSDTLVNNLLIPSQGYPAWMNTSFAPTPNSPAFWAARRITSNGGMDAYGNAIGPFGYNLGAVNTNNGSYGFIALLATNALASP